MKALWGGGVLLWRQGDYGKAMALYEQSLAPARDLGARRARRRSWGALVTRQQGDFDVATALFEESLELSRKLEDKWWMAMTLAQMGVAARRKGDYAKAVAL